MPFELLRKPNIVRIQERYVSSVRVAECRVSRRSDSCVRLAHELDIRYVPPIYEPASGFNSVVRRAVIDDDHLPIFERLVADGVDGGRDGLLRVEGWRDDTNHGAKVYRNLGTFLERAVTGGLLQVWMDGAQIANYSGPLGVGTVGVKDYFKFGYYNWSDYKTPRKALLRSPVVVQDPAGKYGPEMLLQSVLTG